MTMVDLVFVLAFHIFSPLDMGHAYLLGTINESITSVIS